MKKKHIPNTSGVSICPEGIEAISALQDPVAGTLGGYRRTIRFLSRLLITEHDSLDISRSDTLEVLHSLEMLRKDLLAISCICDEDGDEDDTDLFDDIAMRSE